MRYFLAGLLWIGMGGWAWGQVSLTNASNSVTIDFSSSTPSTVGTNPPSAFSGAGFSPNPTTSGQLNSNAWATTGWSDGSLAFGGTNTSGDHARGSTSVAVTTGGIYAYTGSPQSTTNPCLMIQPGAGDWAPGTLTLRIINNGNSNITSLAVSYNIYVRNDQGRANSFNFSYSTDNVNYTSIPALNYTSPEAADANGWVLVGTAPSRSTTISSLNIAPGSYFYIRWSGNDVSGSGSRDEFGLDDISITATFASTNSSSSDIIRNTSFTEPENINYASYQENDLTSSSLEVARFDIRDGGGSADGDSYGTSLTAITFSVTNWANLRRLAIYDGTTEIAETAVSSGTVTFSGLSGLTAPDDGSKTFTLRASFQATVTDNQQFQFTITSATADPSGSTFAASNAGGAQSSTSGDRNRIEVTATELRFSNVPSSVMKNSNFSLTVSATDALGNTDADNSSSITLGLNTGTGNLTSSGGLTRSLSSGTRTWSDLQYDKEESSVTIQTTNFDGLTEDTTSAINVVKGLRDDFTDGDFTNNPTWSGSVDSFLVLTNTTIPNGTASTDGFFLATRDSVNFVALSVPSIENSEWKFSLASTQFAPSAVNYFGVVLMSDRKLSGTIMDSSWNGYYLRIGENAPTADSLALWRSSGFTKTKIGDFPSSPGFSAVAASEGVNLRITRSPSGVFELFYSTGFTYTSTPTTSAGTLTDNTYSQSSYFGVFTHFTNRSGGTTKRRVYMDNISTGSVSSDINSSMTKIDIPMVNLSSLVDTPEEDTVLFAFMLKDSAGGDELATIVDSLYIRPGTGNQTGNWTSVIGGARLTNTHGNPINAVGQIRPDKIVFSGSPFLRIADGSQDSLYLHVYLRKAALPDTIDNNRLVMSLNVNDIFGPQDSSRFAPSSPTIADSVVIRVVATKISLAEEPAAIYYGQPFSIKAYTADENGTRDEDASASVTLQLQTGSATLSSSTGLTQNLVNGIFIWTDLFYNGAFRDSFSIRTSNSGGYMNDTTNIIIVSRPPIVISEYSNDATNEVIELMVVDGPLDIRGWAITDNEPSRTENKLIDGNEGYYGFSNSYVWQYLPSGTIIQINRGSSAANDTTINQKTRDYLIVQNTNQSAGLLLSVEGGGSNPNLNLADGGDNLLLVKDDDGNPENGYIQAINAIYWGTADSISVDPYGPASATNTGTGDNGYYLNTSDSLDLGNFISSNWLTSSTTLPTATYGSANSNGTVTQALFTYQGAHAKVTNTNVTNFSGYGDESVTLHWTLPEGYSKLKNNIYVIIDDDLPWTANELPVRFTHLAGLTANTVYGSGYLFGNGSYLIARTDTNFLDVSGLTGGGQNYYVRFYTIKDDFMYYEASDTYIFTSNQDNDVSLPVQLSQFKIEEISSDGHIRLLWRTESEIGNAYFLVQRRIPEGEYETLAQIPGQGTKTSATDYSYTDEYPPQTDTLVYRLADVAYDGTVTFHEPQILIRHVPARFDLLPNYPNPFNPATTIRYDLKESGKVSLKIYNILGQEVRTLVNGRQNSGNYKVQWDGKDNAGKAVASGVYLYRLEAGNNRIARKMLLLK